MNENTRDDSKSNQLLSKSTPLCNEQKVGGKLVKQTNLERVKMQPLMIQIFSRKKISPYTSFFPPSSAK